MDNQPLLQVWGDGKGGLRCEFGPTDLPPDLTGLLGDLVVALARGQCPDDANGQSRFGQQVALHIDLWLDHLGRSLQPPGCALEPDPARRRHEAEHVAKEIIRHACETWGGRTRLLNAVLNGLSTTYQDWAELATRQGHPAERPDAPRAASRSLLPRNDRAVSHDEGDRNALQTGKDQWADPRAPVAAIGAEVLSTRPESSGRARRNGPDQRCLVLKRRRSQSVTVLDSRGEFLLRVDIHRIGWRQCRMAFVASDAIRILRTELLEGRLPGAITGDEAGILASPGGKP